MIRLIIGFTLGILATTLYYESSNLLLNTKRAIDTKISEQVPNIRESLAALSEAGISIDFQDIVPTIRSLGENLLDNKTSKPSSNPHYYVQVGAFSKQKDGEQLKANLLLKGFLSQHIFVESDKTESLYRVLIGPYTEKGKAIMSLSWAHQQQFEGLVVQRPNT